MSDYSTITRRYPYTSTSRLASYMAEETATSFWAGREAYIALVIGIIALILIIILFVIYFLQRDRAVNDGLPLEIIDGKVTDNNTSLTFGGNEYYTVARGVTSLVITKPNSAAAGRYFYINNQYNTNNLTIVPSNITFQNTANHVIDAGKTAMFVYLNDNNLDRVLF